MATVTRLQVSGLLPPQGAVSSGLTLDTKPLSLPDSLQDGDVRLRITACGLNFPDILMMRGLYQFKPPLPFTPGMEACGVVEDIGGKVSHVKVGQEVMVQARYGLCQRHVVVDATQVRTKPARLSFAQAAGFTVAYLTAYVALVRRGNLRAGEVLLVHGASGGVGLAAVDLGKKLGATVIATSRSAQKRDFIKKYGADYVVSSAQSFKDEVKEITQGHGANVIYDPVGGDVFATSMGCIAWGGRLLVVGFASGTIPLAPVNLPLIKGFSIVGVRAGEYGRRDLVKGRENILAIDRLADSSALHPHVGASFPLFKAGSAFDTLAKGDFTGKVIITMEDG